MEFHDVLHGRVTFERREIGELVGDLLKSTELQRLRNMRQMNFDVPLIQELGKSRRLPHSIGVAALANRLAESSRLSLEDTKALIAAALLHDAAIPPYGHLVENEFKQLKQSFTHEDVLKSFIFGTLEGGNSYAEILPGRQLEVSEKLEKRKINRDDVLNLVSPRAGGSPIAADVDLDNLDNVHRMAVLLGWPGAKENFQTIVKSLTLNGLKRIEFSKDAGPLLECWLDLRQKIYTMIIAHPECIPHNALQSDLVRLAVANGIISQKKWFISEPEFEEALRNHSETSELASQLISGCEYQLIDYVWFKEIQTNKKLRNTDVREEIEKNVFFSGHDISYFVWCEKGLITRRIEWNDNRGNKHRLGTDSHSCMIALLKKSQGGISNITLSDKAKWRQKVIESFQEFIESREFKIALPSEYTGNYQSIEDGLPLV